MRHVRRSLAVLGLLLGALPLAGQTDDEKQMKKDIEALKAGQQAIQNELAEIKRVLQSRPGAAADALPAEPVSIANEPVKGSGTAKVALIEFSDYQCPFCSRYTKDALPQIRRDYVDTGKIKYVFRDMPLGFHKQAFKAAEAAHCAGAQGKFWEMHDTLFDNQSALSPEQLPGYAKGLGIDDAAFAQCLESGRYISDINKDMVEASAAGVTGTPSFLVGVIQPGDGRVRVVKKLVGARPYEDFKAALDGALATP
jgi:protein-disulfide isomerase